MIYLSKALVGVAGCALIGEALYITKDANCLWGLIIVALVLGSY